MAQTDQQLSDEEQVQAARELRQRTEEQEASTPEETGTIGDQIGYGEQKQAARQLRQQRSQVGTSRDAVAEDMAQAQSFGGKLRQARHAIRSLSRTPASIENEAEELTEAVAVQAQQRLWAIAHEILEDITISVWPLAFIIGFAPVGLLVLRLVLAYPLRSYFTITFRGVSVALAPPLSAIDILRFKGILAYGAWGLEWVIIIILVQAISST